MFASAWQRACRPTAQPHQGSHTHMQRGMLRKREGEGRVGAVQAGDAALQHKPNGGRWP